VNTELDRHGVGVARIERDRREELIFNAETLELLGTRQVLVNTDLDSPCRSDRRLDEDHHYERPLSLLAQQAEIDRIRSQRPSSSEGDQL
jgi:hypothetical protein